MSAGAVVLRRQNQILHIFRAAYATSPGTAKTLGQLGCENTLVLRGLVRKGVIVACDGDRYYLDPPLAESFLARRRRRIVFFLLAGLVTMIVILSL